MFHQPPPPPNLNPQISLTQTNRAEQLLPPPFPPTHDPLTALHHHLPRTISTQAPATPAPNRRPTTPTSRRNSPGYRADQSPAETTLARTATGKPDPAWGRPRETLFERECHTCFAGGDEDAGQGAAEGAVVGAGKVPGRHASRECGGGQDQAGGWGVESEGLVDLLNGREEKKGGEVYGCHNLFYPRVWGGEDEPGNDSLECFSLRCFIESKKPPYHRE